MLIGIGIWMIINKIIIQQTGAFPEQECIFFIELFIELILKFLNGIKQSEQDY
jgi:hypothetical protein